MFLSFLFKKLMAFIAVSNANALKIIPKFVMNKSKTLSYLSSPGYTQVCFFWQRKIACVGVPIVMLITG